MKKAVVVGTGALGVALGGQLTDAGYHIVFISRSGKFKSQRQLPSHASYEHITLDLTSQLSVDTTAFQGADCVYFCAAPRYWLWTQELLPLVKNSVTLASALSVPFIYADNLYAYGSPEGVISEKSFVKARTEKGIARKQAMDYVLQAHETGDAVTAIVQASDFYGPGVDIAMLGEAIVNNVSRGQAAYCLGDIDKQHSFTYIDDFAVALLQVKKDESAYGQVWIAPCDKPLTMREFIQKLAKQAGQPCYIRVAPKIIFWLMSLRNKALKELKEVFYLYTDDFIVSSQKFEQHFNIQPTPIDIGISNTLSVNTSIQVSLTAEVSG